MVRKLAFVLLSIFSLHLALCFGIVIYLSISIPLETRKFQNTVTASLQGNVDATDLAEFSQSLENNLSQVVSQHEPVIQLLAWLARPFIHLRRNDPSGPPTFDEDMLLLVASAGVWALLATSLMAAILLLTSLILSLRSGLSTHPPAGDTAAEAALRDQSDTRVRDIIGLTAVHIGLSVLVFIIYFTASVSGDPHQGLRALYTLFQLPITVVVLPPSSSPLRSSCFRWRS